MVPLLIVLSFLLFFSERCLEASDECPVIKEEEEEEEGGKYFYDGHKQIEDDLGGW